MNSDYLVNWISISSDLDEINPSVTWQHTELSDSYQLSKINNKSTFSYFWIKFLSFKMLTYWGSERVNSRPVVLNLLIT